MFLLPSTLLQAVNSQSPNNGSIAVFGYLAPVMASALRRGKVFSFCGVPPRTPSRPCLTGVPPRTPLGEMISPRPPHFDLVILAGALSPLSPGDSHTLLNKARTLAPSVLLLDRQLEERNLHIPASLIFKALCCLAKADIRRRIADFERAGGLEALLYSHRHSLNIIERNTLWGGSFGWALGVWC